MFDLFQKNWRFRLFLFLILSLIFGAYGCENDVNFGFPTTYFTYNLKDVFWYNSENVPVAFIKTPLSIRTNFNFYNLMINMVFVLFSFLIVEKIRNSINKYKIATYDKILCLELVYFIGISIVNFLAFTTRSEDFLGWVYFFFTIPLYFLINEILPLWIIFLIQFIILFFIIYWVVKAYKIIYNYLVRGYRKLK